MISVHIHAYMMYIHQIINECNNYITILVLLCPLFLS